MDVRDEVRRQRVVADELMGRAEPLLRRSAALIAISRSRVLTARADLDRARRIRLRHHPAESCQR